MTAMRASRGLREQWCRFSTRVRPHGCRLLLAVRGRGNPRGQQGTPTLTLPPLSDGLRVLLMGMLWPFRRPSMCRPMHRQFLRNELLDLTAIVPAII